MVADIHNYKRTVKRYYSKWFEQTGSKNVKVKKAVGVQKNYREIQNSHWLSESLNDNIIIL